MVVFVDIDFCDLVVGVEVDVELFCWFEVVVVGDDCLYDVV